MAGVRRGLPAGFGETSGFVASAAIMLIMAGAVYIISKRKRCLIRVTGVMDHGSPGAAMRLTPGAS